MRAIKFLCLALVAGAAETAQLDADRAALALQQLLDVGPAALGDLQSPAAAIEEARLKALAAQLEASLVALRALRPAQDRKVEDAQPLELAAATAEQNLHATAGPRPPRSLEDAQRVEPFIAFCLFCVTVMLVRGKHAVDLFSAEVYSPWEAALALTLSSITGFVLVSDWTEFYESNPITLYISELIVCFLAVVTSVPMLLGTRRNTPNWHVWASFFAVLAFGFLCLSDELSIVVLFLKELDANKKEYLFGPVFVVFVLYVSMLLLTLRKVASRYIKVPLLEPFQSRCVRQCKEYVRKRLASRARGSDLPVTVPTVVLVQVTAVGAIMAMMQLEMALLAWMRYQQLRELALALLRPIEPVFRAAGSPLPEDVLDFAMPRVIVTYFLALGCAAVYQVWLLRSVLRGYKRMFQEFALRRPYHGQDNVTSVPSSFHAQWGTYCCGALLGNAFLAQVSIMFFLWIIFLLLSLPQFWEAQWAIRDYWILYALLYTTRKCIFLFVIPAKVVTDDGAVLRRRVWALMFPTLTILNLVLGATSGIIRALVIAPYLLINFFRIDITYLPSDMVEWDWSFQPFVCLVMQAHRQLNPTMIAIVSELGSTVRERSSAAAEGPATSASTPQELGSIALSDVERQAPHDEAPSMPSRARTMPCTLNSRRARQRWQLALVLARNPSLRHDRRGPLRSAESAPARMNDALAASDAASSRQEAPAPLPPLLPRLPTRRQDSTSSFWTPLNIGRGPQSPLLSDSRNE